MNVYLYIVYIRGLLPAGQNPYGDLTIISPTIISERKTLMVVNNHVARGVEFMFVLKIDVLFNHSW